MKTDRDYGAARRHLAVPRGEIGVARALGVLAAVVVFFASGAAYARGAPESFADLAERLTPAVVNIATAQSMRPSQAPETMPQVPPGTSSMAIAPGDSKVIMRASGERQRSAASYTVDEADTGSRGRCRTPPPGPPS